MRPGIQADESPTKVQNIMRRMIPQVLPRDTGFDTLSEGIMDN